MWDALMQCFCARRRDFIIPANRNHRWDGYFTKTVGMVPIFQISNHREFIGTIHCFINRRFAEVNKGALEWFRSLCKTAVVAFIEFPDSLYIIWISVITGSLKTVQCFVDLQGQLRYKALCFRYKLRSAGRGAGKDQAFYTGWMCGHIFDGQPAAPRMAQ